MAQELKKSIYLQGGVIDVYTETRNKERPQSFSKRMGQIVFLQRIKLIEEMKL